tara:strand:+ start:331 stop:1221 length:891 start_codon:yes stop_codon:yes gene_type:complete
MKKKIFFSLKRILLLLIITPPRGMFRLSRLLKKLIIDEKYYLIALHNFDIYVCPSHTIGNQIIRDKFYEKEISEIITYFINRGFNFIDMGANIGYHTLLAASNSLKSNKGRNIFAIEPDVELFDILKKNGKKNNFNNITFINKAFGEKLSSKYLNIPLTPNKGRTSLLPIPKSKKSSKKVEIDTIDNVFLNEIKYFNNSYIIKIDVEGYEFPILKGGKEWLKKIPQLAIVIEILPNVIQNTEWELREIYNFLIEAGFNKFFRIVDKPYGYDYNHLILKNLNDISEFDSKILVEYFP